VIAAWSCPPGARRERLLLRDQVCYTRDWSTGAEVGGEEIQWVLTRVFWGGGALEVGNLRLLEDGGKRGGALVSDLV